MFRRVAAVGSAAVASGAGETEQNKRSVVDFYQHAVGRKDFDSAARYLGQH